MARITDLKGREILDSRGYPTVEARVLLDDGTIAKASVPSGASTGAHEALELRDGEENRYQGKGVLKAVAHVNTEIRDALIGMDPSEQRQIDTRLCELDGTESKSRLGANAILGASLACARAAAESSDMALYAHLEDLIPYKREAETFPVPMFNVINGGEHADSGLSIQEFKIVPVGIVGYPEQLRAGSEIFHTLQKLLRTEGYTTDVGDEGGFAPRLKDHAEAFMLLVKAIEASGYVPGKEVLLDIDAAANSFYDRASDRYLLKPEKAVLDHAGLAALYREWTGRFPIFSIEDPFHEEDWGSWSEFKREMGAKLMLVGDDLLVTSVKRLRQAIEADACNAVLIKVNQIGTLSETIDCIALAKEHGMRTVISHRSGETCDDFIADLAVAAGADYIKTGSLARGERLAKYNRLSEIFEMRFVPGA
ncbi:MAG: phosphopyruvate hydratase [Candidatus Moraniibacteriota bacterium]|nr:MAG: phosphopyruvate hydratase [Candidatus Moranbacteria bacterium]